MEIRTVMKEHRKLAGLTQVELARLAGVGKTVIYDIEHGKESVQWDTLKKVFAVLNIKVDIESPLLKRKRNVPAEVPDMKPNQP